MLNWVEHEFFYNVEAWSEHKHFIQTVNPAMWVLTRPRKVEHDSSAAIIRSKTGFLMTKPGLRGYQTFFHAQLT